MSASSIGTQKKSCLVKQGKPTSRFGDENSQRKSNQLKSSDKAFFILLEACQELIQIHSADSSQQIEDAINSNQPFEHVAMMVNEILIEIKKEFITSEFKYIQLKEEKQSVIFQEKPVLQVTQTMDWRQLFFQEAKTVVDMCQQLRESNQQMADHVEYIDKLERRISQSEDEFLQLYREYHFKTLTKQFSLNLTEKEELRIQLQQSRLQTIDLAKRLQEEIMKIQASQELRINDLRYIMSLESKVEMME